MVIFGTYESGRSLAGYRLGLVYDELPPELRGGMVSQGIVDQEVRLAYDVEAYSSGGVHLRVYRRRPGWSNEEGMDGPITLHGLHGLYYCGFDLPNYYTGGTPEAWLELPSEVDAAP